MTLNTDDTVAGLTINPGVTLTATNNDDLTVNGSIVNNGTYTSNGERLYMTGAGATISGTGTFNDTRLYIDATNITLTAGSTMNFSGGANIRVGNNNDGSLTIAGSITDIGQPVGERILRLDDNNTSSVTIIGTLNAPNSYVEIQDGGTLTNNGTVNIQYLDGNGDNGSTWTQGTNSNLTMSAPAQGWAGTFNASAPGNTVTYDGTATPLTPSGNTYYNLDGTYFDFPGACPTGFNVLGTSPCDAIGSSGSVSATPGVPCVSDASNGSGYAWTGLGNVGASDDQYAQANGYNSSVTQYLKCTGYGFNIPANATITGIALGVEAHSRRTFYDAYVHLVKGGAIQTTTNYGNNSRLSQNDSTVSYGGPTDVWGGTWAVNDINSTAFGAAFAAQRGPYTTTDTAFVDTMPITVYYTLPPAPTVSTITRNDPDPTNAQAVSWTVTFSADVTGVDPADFVLAQDGTLSGTSVTQVSGSGAVWVVTADTGSGAGTLRLDLIDNDSIVDAADKPLGGAGSGNGNFTTGDSYTIERTRTIDSVTLDGAASVTVAPDASITTAIQVTTTGGGSNAWWRSTGWLIDTAPPGAVNCVDHPNHDSSGTFSESFDITAPSAPGTYSAYFIAYSDDSCTQGASALFTLADAVTVEIPAISTPAANYAMDEAGWDGTPGEVIDRSGNNRHGTAVNGASTVAAGQVCRAGSFDGNDDYVEVPGLSSLLNSTASLAFWIKTTQVGNDIGWQAPGVTGVEESGGADDIFWGWLDASGRIGISVGNDYTSKSTAPVNDGGWHHVVLTRNASNGAYTIYIDGTLDKSGTIASGDITNNYSSIGRIEDTDINPTPEYFQGELDEVLIFNSVLSPAQVQTGYGNQAVGNNWDGTARICQPGGGGICGIVPGGSTTNAVNSSSLTLPVPTGISTGELLVAHVAVRHSCFLGVFCSNNISMPSGWTIIREDISGGDLLGLGTTMTQGSYYRVVDGTEPGSYSWNFSSGNRAAGGITAYSGVDQDNPIEVHNGQSGSGSTITAPSVTTTTDGAYLVGLFASANGNTDVTPASPLDFRYRTRTGAGGNGVAIAAGSEERPTAGATGSRSASAASTDNIGQLIALRPAICGVPAPDHFRFYHNGSGLTCNPEDIVVRACMDSGCSSEYPDAITATLYPSGWAGGDTQTFASGDTLQLWHTTAGVATLDVASIVGAANPARCYVGGALQANCNIAFYDSGFLFDVPHHTAATDQTVTLSAVRTDDATKQCVPTSPGVSKSVNFWSTYNNPAGGNRAVAINGTDIATAAPGTAVDLIFDANGEAILSVSYPDAGSMLLAAQYLGTGEEAGLVMNGQDSFTAKPAGFLLSNIARLGDGAANPAAADGAGAGFIAAGEPFSVTVTAVNALGATTPNFGQEATAEGVKLSNAEPVDTTGAAVLIAPAGGNNPPLMTPPWRADTAYQAGQLVQFGSNVYQAGGAGTSGATFGTGGVSWVDLGTPLDSSTIFNTSGPFSGGSAVGSYAWEEVGIIDFTARIRDGDYLGAGDVIGTSSGNVGRFFAHTFNASLSPADFAPAAGGFTYLGQPFRFGSAPSLMVTAISSGGSTLLNYEGAFWKLGASILQGGSGSSFLYGDNVGGSASLAAPASAIPFGDTSAAAGSLSVPVHATGNFTYQRPANPVAPFDADVSLQVSLLDDDGASGAASLASIGFAGDSDAGSGNPFSTSDDNLLRFGRAVLADSYGRETEAQRLFFWTHYFDGSGFVSNNADTTTAYSVLPTDPATPPNLTNPLCSPVAGPVVCSNVTVSGSNVGHGQAFTLSAPGAGKQGALNYELAVDSWLQYDWDSDGITDNPVAHVKFGIFRGDDRFIYWREVE